MCKTLHKSELLSKIWIHTGLEIDAWMKTVNKYMHIISKQCLKLHSCLVIVNALYNCVWWCNDVRHKKCITHSESTREQTSDFQIYLTGQTDFFFMMRNGGGRDLRERADEGNWQEWREEKLWFRFWTYWMRAEPIFNKRSSIIVYFYHFWF